VTEPSRHHRQGFATGWPVSNSRLVASLSARRRSNTKPAELNKEEKKIDPVDIDLANAGFAPPLDVLLLSGSEAVWGSGERGPVQGSIETSFPGVWADAESKAGIPLVPPAGLFGSEDEIAQSGLSDLARITEHDLTEGTDGLRKWRDIFVAFYVAIFDGLADCSSSKPGGVSSSCGGAAWSFGSRGLAEDPPRSMGRICALRARRTSTGQGERRDDQAVGPAFRIVLDPCVADWCADDAPKSLEFAGQTGVSTSLGNARYSRPSESRRADAKAASSRSVTLASYEQS
jgi:hypothetical protein